MKYRFLFGIAFTLSMLAASSCSKILEPLYVRISGTEWVYELDGTRAIIHFGVDGTASVVQRNIEVQSAKQNNGTYSAQGHRVSITGNDGTTAFNLIRTFSHLKTSQNKNMNRYAPVHRESVAQMVWAGADVTDLSIYYFQDAQTLVKASFTTASGWEKTAVPYTLSGYYTFTSDEGQGWFFPDGLLAADGFWRITLALPEGSGSSALEGSMWAGRGLNGNPDILIFNTGYSFVRALFGASGLFVLYQGTYSVEENSVTLVQDGSTDVCPISGGESFSYKGQSYDLLR